jgi:phage antirepressor YoqD-like protein
MTDEFLSMTELGKLYGISSHKMGKWLVELGLRNRDNKPSRAAFENGFVEQRDSTQPGTYFWVWHAEKTKWALEKEGHKRVESGQA